MKKVVIIDGLNMFLRSYIINPTMDPKGNIIGGAIGFIKSLQKTVWIGSFVLGCWSSTGPP